jgi:putative membrane protein
MPSEQRLHPVSLLFAFAGSLKTFALPGLLAALSLGRASSPWRPTFGPFQPPDTWELWLMLLIVPSLVAALARYLSFRLRYGDTEMVIRSGIVFRNERHVPYHRIQNLDAVQNVVHRLLGVMEVRVDTGASKEPEATISVIPVAAFADMRRRVFAGRSHPPGGEAAMDVVAAPEDGRTLLRLPLRELLLSGMLENRGLVVVAAFYGLLWESGLFGPLWDRVFADGSYTPGMVRGIMRTIAAGEPLPLGPLAVIVSGIVLLLLLVRGLSMALAVTRLYGFRLSRVGDDLRSEFGLLTRVSATIPVRRVQSLTVRAAPLYRLCSRTTVRVETAGGSSPQGGQQPATRQREMLAPIVHERDAAALVRDVLPEVDLSAIEWRPPHPRAFRRAIKPALALAAIITLGAMGVIHRAAVFAFPFIALWMIVVTRKYIQHLGWAITDDLVALRSGWLWRSITVVPLGRIQAVGRLESPFDRRTAMARVRVDTAGASERSHRIDIPYLPVETATELHRRLAAAAASSTFRW